MLTFNIFQVVLISGLINSLILFFSLFRIEQKYRKSAFYLGLFIVGYLVNQVDLLVLPDLQRTTSFIIPHLPILFFLPALFFYFVHSVFFPKERLPGNYTWMLIPGLLDVLYSLGSWIYVQKHSQGAVYDFITGRTGFFLHEGIAILFSLFVVAILVKVLKTGRTNTETFHFFKLILSGIFIIILRWVLLVAINVIKPDYPTAWIENFFWIFEAAFLIYVGYKILNAPRILNINYTAAQIPDGDTLREEGEKLKKLVFEEKLFSRPDLVRKDLAESMKCTEVHISSLLKDGLDTNFYEFINTMRIQEAVRLIEENKLNLWTVEALAKEVGFKSKTTFYKVFKSETGLTPSAFSKK